MSAPTKQELDLEHAAYQIAHGLREMLYWSTDTPENQEADDRMREGGRRLREGLTTLFKKLVR